MALAVGWLRRLQQEWIIPEVIPERCVHSHCEVAECARCVEACPRDAWLLTDDSLKIDTERCDGCGLCVAACTESALGQPLLPALRMHEGNPTLLFACEVIGEEYAGEGVVPCLHAITSGLLLEHYRNGYRQVLSCRGYCETCPRYGGRDFFRQQLAQLNSLLTNRAAPTIKHAEITTLEWETRRKSPDASLVQGKPGGTTNRRQFLRRAITFTVEKSIAQVQPPTATPALPWPATLPTPEHPPGKMLYPFVPQMDALRCNGCDTCLQLCPHQALQVVKAEGQAVAYQIQAEYCTGCDICVDSCDQHAIHIKPMYILNQAQITLTTTQCKACGCRFHYPADGAEVRPYCRICSRTNHHRKLFQVY